MTTTAKKMSKIIDELVSFFFGIGSDDIQMDLKKLEDGYSLYLRSGFLPENRKKVEDLNRFFNNSVRNEGMEEFFWQLAGVSTSGQDSELALVGQMIDKAEITVSEGQVELTILKRVER